MNNLFIPYELALKLKELGFDEKCFKYCLLGVGIIGKHKESGYLIIPVKNSELGSTSYTVPLWQQAFEWFRKKGFRFYPFFDHDTKKYWIDIWKVEGEKVQFYFESDSIYQEYHEAEEALLRKLIEIVNK